MENVTLAIAEDEIEQQAQRCRELEEQRRTLLARIERADAEKASARQSIYEKVRGEYETRLRAVERDLEPLVSALEKRLAAIEGEIKQVAARLEEIADRADEIAFRLRVGEFDEAAFEELRAPIEEERAELTRRRRELSGMLSRLGGRAPAEAPEPAIAAPRVPAEDTAPQGEPEAAGAFVDPSDWLGEFLPDGPAEGAAPADPLANLADPGNESGETSENTAARPLAAPHAPEKPRVSERSHATEAPHAPERPHAPEKPRVSERSHAAEAPHTPERPHAPANARAGSTPPGLPILTIASGPGAGKKLPLLPVTMTLGREVDNNIELKDKDVARYHARISFESGRYVIQDLEGSSGTFVNGEKVTKAALETGDRIRVGNTELTLDAM